MRILVSGGTGFVGGRLLEALAGQHELVVLHRGPAPAPTPGVTWIAQDLREPLVSSLPEQVDAVIHLAQSRHYRDFPERAADIFGVNVQGTFQLLEYARRASAQRFVLASTGGLYAPSSEEAFVEGDPVDPLSFYLGSKYAAEVLAAKYQELFSLVVCRLFFAYGSGQPATMLIPRLVARVAEGRPIDLHGPDGFSLNPIHVSDVVRILARTLHVEGNHLLNVAGPDVLTLRAVGAAIGAVLGREPSFVVHPPREPGRLVGNIERLTDLLGPPRVTFEEGLAELCRTRRDDEA